MGLRWNRKSDTISAPCISLDAAADSKRKVLKSVASQYDVLNFQGPILNRARLFLHSLQNDNSISWDQPLDSDKLSEWKKICKQANDGSSVELKRFVGDRDGEYELLAFVDASKFIYAAVVYIKVVGSATMSFLAAKNRLVNKQLELKTIPSLELQAIALGVELLNDLNEELSGEKCVKPINIVDRKLYSDSMISLHWIQSYLINLTRCKSSRSSCLTA